MTESKPSRATESSGEGDDLGRMLEEVASDPIVRAGYEDAMHREGLREALVAARGSISQKSVAAAMGTTQSAVSDIENGRVDPRLSTLQRFARAVHRRIEVTLHLEQPSVSAESNAGESQTDGQAQQLEKKLTEVQEQAGEQALDDILRDLYREGPKSGPQSTAAVAERTGLREPTVWFAMDRLRVTGWLDVISPPRAPEPRFSLSPERGLVIGMSLNRDHIDAVLTDIRASRVVAQRTCELADTSPRLVTQAIVDLFEELRHAAGQGPAIIGLGVALAGRVDGPTGTVFFAPDLQTDDHQWSGVPLEADLEEAIQVKAPGGAVTRVVVENDANALGMYEYLLRSEDQSVSVVLMGESGEGIGGGLVINGGIAHGTGGVGGEIGHVVVDPDGEPCRCGMRGCLETVASGTAILKKARKLATSPITNLNEAAELAEQGDEAILEVFTAAGEALGWVLSSVTKLVGTTRLVIFGPPQLAEEHKLRSAHAFMEGVRRVHGHMILGVKVDIEPRILDHVTLSKAAAATAVHYFLSRPQRWIPTIASPAAGHKISHSMSHARLSAGSSSR